MKVKAERNKPRGTRDAQISALADLGRLALAAASADTIVQRAVETMRAAFRAKRAAVWQRQPDGGLVVRASDCWPDAAAAADDALEAVRTGGVVIRRGAVSALTVPIGQATAPWGALSMQAEGGKEPTPADVDMLVATANLLAGVARRVMAEDGRGREEARLRTVVENVSDLIVLADGAGKVTFASPSVRQMLGRSPEEMYGRDSLEFVHPDDRLLVASGREVAVAHLGSPHEVECRLAHADGGWRTVHALGRTVSGPDGELQFVMIIRDVTARREVERQLREREARFARQAKLFNEVQTAARIGGWELDLVTGALYWTDETYVLHETTPDDYTPTLETAIAFYTESSRPRITAAIEDAVRAGTGWDLELEIVTAQGRLVAVRAVGAVDRDQGKPVRLYGAFQDLSERRGLEEQFRQAQKMEAVGQLAGGIAHDFNNLLTVMQGHASLLEADGAASDDAADSVRAIREAADRAARLTRQLLVFSRRQAMRAHDVDLNEVVGNVTNMLQRIVGEDIRVQLRMSGHPEVVRADPGMIEQVIVNLATNARDAMPRGGRLLIETATVTIDAAAALASHNARSGEWTSLTVSDSGVGIARDLLPRIFEPFFTTKEVGKGTGLGLANVYGIVQQHEGWVDVDSEPGRGATFRIYLPRAPGAAAVAADATAARPADVRHGSETILLVEDEAALRALGRRSLERLGYHVLEARSGVSALVAWAAHQSEVSLLLTDMIMPGGMNGADLVRRLRRDRPDLKVLYMSGYTDGTALTELERLPNVEFVAKPFTLGELGEAVGRMLESGETVVR